MAFGRILVWHLAVFWCGIWPYEGDFFRTDGEIEYL